MQEYTFKVRLINEEYVTVEANDFEEAVEKADHEADKMAYGNYEFWSIEEVNE